MRGATVILAGMLAGAALLPAAAQADMYIVTNLGNTFPLYNWEGAAEDVAHANESGVALFSGAPRIVERDNAGRIFTEGNGRFELRPAGTYMGMDGVDVVAAVYERTTYTDIPVGKLGAIWHYNGTGLEYLSSTTPSTIDYKYRGIPAPGHGGTTVEDSAQGVTISGDGYAIVLLEGMAGGLHLHGEGPGKNAVITHIESRLDLFNETAVSGGELLGSAVPSTLEFVPVAMGMSEGGADVHQTGLAASLNVYTSRLPVVADYAIPPEGPLPEHIRYDDSLWSYTIEDGNPWDPFYLPTYREAAAGGPYAGLDTEEDGACRVFLTYEYEGAYVISTVAGEYLHIVPVDSDVQYTVDLLPYSFASLAGTFADAGAHAPWPGGIIPPWGERAWVAAPLITYEPAGPDMQNGSFAPDRLGRVLESRGTLGSLPLEYPGVYNAGIGNITVRYPAMDAGPNSCGMGGLMDHSLVLEYTQDGVFTRGETISPGQYSRLDYPGYTDELLLVRMHGGSLTLFNGAPAEGDGPGIYDAPVSDAPTEDMDADPPPEPPLARALYFIPEHSPGHYLDLVSRDGCYVQLNGTDCIIRYDRGSLYHTGDDGWKLPGGRILSRNGPSDVPPPEDLGRIVYDWHLPWDDGLWYFTLPGYPGRYFDPLPLEYTLLDREQRCYTGMLSGDIEGGICRIEWNSDTLDGCWVVRTDNLCIQGISNGRGELPRLEQLGANGVHWPGPEGYRHGGNPAEFFHPAAPGYTMSGTPHVYIHKGSERQCYAAPGYQGPGDSGCVILSNYMDEHCWRHAAIEGPAHCISSNPADEIPAVLELAGDAFAAGGPPVAVLSVTGLPGAPYELLAGIPEIQDDFVVPGTVIPLAFEPYFYDHRHSYRDYYCYRGAEDSGHESECVIRYARSEGGPVCWVHAELPGTCLSGNAKLNPPGWRELAGGAPGTITTGISAGITTGTVRGEFSGAGEHLPYDYTLRVYTGALVHDFADDPVNRLVVFDKQNDAVMPSVIPLEPPRRILYNSGTYVQLPFPGDVHLGNVTIHSNGTGGCPGGCKTGISGLYLGGERAYIPVVPAHTTVHMEIDGEGTRFEYSDVASPTGIRIPDRASSHTSEESDGAILQAGTRASAHASAVAPSDGVMKVLVSGTAGGSILIGNNWVGTEVDYQCVIRTGTRHGLPVSDCTDTNSGGAHCWDKKSGRKYGTRGCITGDERRLWRDLGEAPSYVTALLRTYVNGELRGEDVIAQAPGEYHNGAEALDRRPEVSCRQGFKTVFGSSGPHTTPLGVSCTIEEMRAGGFERSSTKYTRSFGPRVTGYEMHTSPELAGYSFEGVPITGSSSVGVGAGDFVEFELVVDISAEAEAQEFAGVRLRGHETGLRGASGYSDAELELGSLSFITAM